MLGRIKIGAKIFQDFSFGKWPQCKPPHSEYEGEEYQYKTKNPDRIFEIEDKGTYFACRAAGYGHLKLNGDRGEYGNGRICVYEKDGIEILQELP